MDISFNFLTTTTLPNRRRLRAFISTIFVQEGMRLASLSFVFCTDKYLLEINRTYLEHDHYTDIITFDLTEAGAKTISGEVYLSVERIRANAQEFGVTLQQELHRVMFHGILHLCGYADKSPKEKVVMTNKENLYLSAYGLL